MQRSLPLILAFCLLCSCGPATVNTLVKDKGAQRMAATEVLTLVTDNTLSIRTFNEDAALYFAPSGQLFGKDISSEKDQGKWDVSQEGELCFRMTAWWYGDLRCFQVYRAVEKNRVHLASSSGVLQYTVEQQTGDSNQLSAGGDRDQKSQRRSIRNQQDVGKQDIAAVETRARTPNVIEEQPKSDSGMRDTSATIQLMAKDCPGCNLAGADLGRADLIGAKLAKADLHGANLSMANLRRADLQGANLRDAVLAYANMPATNLRGADLRGAVLKGANLIQADLTGARLEGADLTEALKEGAKGLK